MRKILLLPFLVLITSWNANAQCPSPEIAPWTDNVELMTPTTANINQNCWVSTGTGYDWNIDGAGSTPSTGTGPVSAFSGNNYFYVEASSGTAGVSTCTLTSPQVDVSALTTPAIEFYYHMFGTTMGTLTIEAWDGVQWNVVDQIVGQQQTVQSDPWLLRSIALTGYTGVIQVRFVALSGGTFTGDMSIDDVSIVEAPTCPQPNQLTATNVLSTSADLGWNETGSATMWNIEYGPSGFTPGTGTMVTGATNNPENITGLSPVTNYQFYVQSDCGGGDLSSWSGPYSFLTACAPYVAPWTDDLETQPAMTGTWTTSLCWDQTTPSSTTLYDWNVTTTGTTPTTLTGANSAHSGTRYFYTEGSYGTNGVSTAVIESPFVDVSAITTMPKLEFWYHMTGAQIGTLTTEVWDGTTWNQVDVMSGAQQGAQADPWLKKTVYLPGYTGNIKVRFTALSAGTLYGDICIDDISITAAPTCPEPYNFVTTGGDLSSVDLDWMTVGTETEWMLEYGPVGFTPGTGTSIFTNQYPDTITGLTSNSFYDVYVQAVCSPGDTSVEVGPLTFNTYNQGIYMDWNSDCGPGFIDISTTGTPTNLLDDQELGVTLPFPLLFQGTLVTDATIADNGALLLGTQTANLTFSNNTIAASPYQGIYAFWDDIESQYGNIYYQTIGTSPNQTFIVQWDNQSYWPGPSANEVITYQIQILEATGEIYVIYPDSEFGGSDALFDNGTSATQGVNGPNQDIQVSYNSNTYLSNNSCTHYYYTNCPAPVNYTVVYTTNNEAALTWAAGISNETNWTVIYGPAGFDPMTGGTTVTTTTTAAVLTGLTQLTTYDVYIYADCNPGVLQSIALTGDFTTLPNCSDVTGITTATATDSVFTAWNWVESSGVGTYPSTGFNLQYGFMGFNLYDSNIGLVNADNNYTDTTVNTGFLGGGVYDMYVQAVCNTDTSNWVGPITFIMPLTNDSTCNAINLNVDGTAYVFNNTGATAATGEVTIAPPATGAQTTTGWSNSNMSFTTWFTFTAPSTGNMWIDATGVPFDGQIAIYETSNCANWGSYNLIAANDDALEGGSLAPHFSLCGLTPGNTYYLVHDSYSTVTTGNYGITLTEIVINPGATTGIINICTGDTVNLYDGLSGNDMGGTWTEMIATASFNDPYFPSAGLAYQVFDFQYTVVDGCASDSTMQQVQIYGPSSAGLDGTISACQNQPINLLSGLSGNADMGGTWYDPANNPLADGAIITSSIPGQYNYDYITGNGVCPDDTANVVVNVSPSCDYLNLQEVYFGTMDVYPNPTTGVIYVSNYGSVEVFNYTITDLNGKVISTEENAINGTDTKEISLKGLEPGIYMIRVHNDSAEKTFRIVKQ